MGRLAGITGFFAGFAIALVLAVGAGWFLFFRGGTRIDISRPTVIQHIQQLQRLETVVYSMEKIVTGEQASQYFPKLLVGDRLLLVVHGDVTAGVDLGAIDPWVRHRRGQSCGAQATRGDGVFDPPRQHAHACLRTADRVVQHSPSAAEADVRREAERQLTQAALDGGILKTAAANARTTLTGEP